MEINIPNEFTVDEAIFLITEYYTLPYGRPVYKDAFFDTIHQLLLAGI